MSHYSQFKMDENKENDGVKILFSEAENEDGTIPAFFISRMGKTNKRYSKALDIATRPYRRQLELGTLASDVAESVFMSVFADTVLMGWENVRDAKAKDIVFNAQNAIKLFHDLPDVYERLQEESKIVSNFRSAELESEAKN